MIEWKFFETAFGKTVDCRDDPVHTEPGRNIEDGPIAQVLYAGGIYNLKLFGEDCKYMNSGDNAGRLFCRDRGIDCYNDSAWDGPDGDSKYGKAGGEYKCGENMVRQPAFTCPY